MKNTNKKERFYDIDLLRFLAAISVVFFHYIFCAFSTANMIISPVQELSFVTKYACFKEEK